MNSSRKPSPAPRLFNPNGWVVTAFQAALSGVVNTPIPVEQPSDNLCDALVGAVRIGYDTVAAIAGALLGARWWTEAVPDEWNTVIPGDRQHGFEQVTGTELERLARKAAST